MPKRLPPWTRDEVVLACSFLFKNDRRAVRVQDERVGRLSTLLRNLHIYPTAERDPLFRSVNSVRRKLFGLVTILPEYAGPRIQGARIDQLVLQEFLEHEYEMHFEAERIAASAIRAAVPSAVEVMRTATRLLVRTIAACPNELFELEWRDVERVLHEILDRLGYDVTLTRPGKDGGYDLKVVHRRPDGDTETYLLEVKHWAKPAKVGTRVYEGFLEVVLREGAARGLLLSTSGFRPSLLRSQTRISRQGVRLGGAPKIIQLCKSYEQIDDGPWIARPVGPDLLFRDTL
jgi:hypothetical protein